MAEYFEITFFLDREVAKDGYSKDRVLEALNIKEGKNQVSKHTISLFTNKEVLFDVFDEEDFLEYRICLSNLFFTRKNFDVKLEQMLQVVSMCFKITEAIQFVTGIYELTYNCIEGIKNLKDFNTAIFARFPLLFFKTGNERGFHPYRVSNEVVCVFNENAQDIFANPIRELMEDEGLCFQEAQKKANWS